MDEELELRKKATAALARGVELRDKFKGRAPSAEEKANTTTAFDEAQQFLDRADLLKREREIKAILDLPATGRPHGDPAEAKGAGGDLVADALRAAGMGILTPEQRELKALFFKAIKKGLRRGDFSPEQVKSLNSISDKEGGLLLEEEMLPGILSKLRDIVSFRKYATVITTSAATVGLITEDFDPDLATAKEGGTITVEDITNWLGKTNFTPHARKRIFKLPEELLADSKFDLERFWINRFAVRLGEIEESDYLVGNGKGKPLGLLIPGLPTMKATGGTGGSAVAGDDLVNCQGAVKEQYQAGAVWLLKRQTLTTIRLLKSGTTQEYLWQPSFQAGIPPTLLGKPVISSEFMPTPVADSEVAPAVVYGDLSWYTIVDRGAFQVQRLDELYAGEGKVGIKITRRYDGAPTLKDPFKQIVLDA